MPELARCDAEPLEQPAARSVAPGERRQCDRGSCPAYPLVKLLVRPSFHPQGAVARDASRRGVSLWVPNPIPPGSRVVLLARGRRRGASCMISGRVIHLSQRAAGWLVGCELARPLSDEELAAFR